MKVSIGIPAYNEEGNIGQLLRSLLSQQLDGFTLHEIIVVSDASGDKTVSEVNKVENERIKVINHEIRQGKAAGLNDIVRSFSGDMLIFMDADVLPSNNVFLVSLLKELNGKSWALASCQGVPAPSKGLVGKLLGFSVILKNKLYDKVDGGNNIHHCHGFCMVLSRSFAKSFLYPKIVSEDAYTFLQCKQKNEMFVYVPQATLIFKTSENLRDYLNQSRRFMLGDKDFTKYFPRDLIEKSYKISPLIFASTALTFFLRKPIYFVLNLIGYSFLFAISVIVNMFGSASYIWATPTSSKIIEK